MEYQKQKKRDVGVILRWRKSLPPNQGLTYGETSLSAKGSSPVFPTKELVFYKQNKTHKMFHRLDTNKTMSTEVFFPNHFL